MAKLSCTGTGRKCVTIFVGYRRPTSPCPNDASRGSDYCLKCKHAQPPAWSTGGKSDDRDRVHPEPRGCLQGLCGAQGARRSWLSE